MENLVKMLDDKEASRLQKLAEEWEKKQREAKDKDNHNQQSGGAMGGMGGGMNIGGMAGGLKNAAGTFNR
jgi:glycerate kinase